MLSALLLLLAVAGQQVPVAARFDATSSAQLAAGLTTCQGSAPIGHVLRVTATNTFDCAAPALSFRNRLINGNLTINQRSAWPSSTSYRTGAYVMDRWKAGANGVAISWSVRSGGDVMVSISAGTLIQVIEGGIYLPEGGPYVLSWTGTSTGRIFQGSASGPYAASPVTAARLSAGTNAIVEFGGRDGEPRAGRAGHDGVLLRAQRRRVEPLSTLRSTAH
jgi:hypothetical protein